MNHPLRGIFAGAFLAVLVGGSTVVAGETSSPLEVLDFDGMATISEDEMSGQSGRQGIDLLQMNDAEQSALLENNQIQGITSNGSNTIDGSSFSGSVGFTTAIQNSGNNVIIQDTTLVNIVFNQ
jgi:hypothetical protein